ELDGRLSALTAAAPTRASAPAADPHTAGNRLDVAADVAEERGQLVFQEHHRRSHADPDREDDQRVLDERLALVPLQRAPGEQLHAAHGYLLHRILEHVGE